MSAGAPPPHRWWQHPKATISTYAYPARSPGYEGAATT
jgi:hypothetical protein